MRQGYVLLKKNFFSAKCLKRAWFAEQSFQEISRKSYACKTCLTMKTNVGKMIFYWIEIMDFSNLLIWLQPNKHQFAEHKSSAHF